jgi:DNA-binding MarR family transcriptional regulator
MSFSSLAKFNNVLGSIGTSRDEVKSAERHSDPAALVLDACRGGMLPLSDLPELTSLPTDEILKAIERLRAHQQVEVVEVPEAGSRKYIRLTPTGYAHFAA